MKRVAPLFRALAAVKGPRAYMLALLLVGAATGMQGGFEHAFSRTEPGFICFYPAVVFAALLGGIGPGLFATALSGLVATWLFIPPIGSLWIEKGADVAALLFFFFNGALISIVTSRMRAAQIEAATARQSEERFRELADNMPQLAWIADRTGWISWYNRRWYEYTGTTPEEMKGWGWQSVQHPDHVLAVAEKLSGAFKTGAVWEDTFPLRGSDGQYRWFLSRAVPIRDATGTLWRWFGTNTDVTEQRAAREDLLRLNVKLRESEERFRGAVEGLLDAFIIVTPIRDDRGTPVDFRIEYANRVALAYAGRTREAYIGQRIRSDLQPETNALWELYLRVLETGLPVATDDLFYRREGGVYREGAWLDVRMTPLDGSIAVAWRDVTERKRTEVALATSEEKLRVAADGARMGIWDWNIVKGELTWSERCKELFGLSREAAVTYDAFLGALHPEDRKPARRALFMALEYRTDYDVETRVPWPDGTMHWIASKGRGFYDETGKPVRMAGMALDITDRKVMEEELRASRDELERRVEERTRELRQSQKLEALGTMAGGIAHDFNNILAAIIGFTQLAMDHVPQDAPNRKHLEQVTKAGLRGRDLVKQMLAFSRKSEEEREVLRMSGIIEETMKLLRASIPTTVDIRLDASGEAGLVLASPVHVQQVVLNLCSNAFDAMRQEGGMLTLEVRDVAVRGSVAGLDPGPYVRLSVSDTGRGIPGEILDRIFDPFFTTKEPGKGTGLGLSVVHGIVRSYGGAITVESTPAGTTFRVYMPMVREEARAVEGEAEARAAGGNEQVLFVDDEAMLVEMAREMLEGLGYRVTGKTSSREALDLFRQDPERFDLVITDQTMPEMTGLQLAREIASIRDVPVIVSTGFSHLIDAASAEETGIDAFIMKPLTRAELSRVVRKVLDEESVRKAG